MDLIKREFRTLGAVSGPLIFAESMSSGSLGEICEVVLADGRKRTGQILQLLGGRAVIQVLEGTDSIDTSGTRVIPTGHGARAGVSMDLFGRVFNGMGAPIDGLCQIIPEKQMDINGLPMNPVAREKPDFFVQTGISAIDGLNTLVRGQKLPIFSGAGLPAKELAIQIVRQARVAGAGLLRSLRRYGHHIEEAFFFLGAQGDNGDGADGRLINQASDPA
jgi:V/A-type H+-transporting ATPase subunit B